jgi:hypothetical protein
MDWLPRFYCHLLLSQLLPPLDQKTSRSKALGNGMSSSNPNSLLLCRFVIYFSQCHVMESLFLWNSRVDLFVVDGQRCASGTVLNKLSPKGMTPAEQQGLVLVSVFVLM